MPERRLERQLRADYEALLDEIVAGLTADNHAIAVALASIPEKIRGFGHVKLRHIESAKAEEKIAARAIPRWAGASAAGGGVSVPVSPHAAD